jgi:hypothetical protein
MFLKERDRARLRRDYGVERSLTADLRRLGVKDAATFANPSGSSSVVSETLTRSPGTMSTAVSAAVSAAVSMAASTAPSSIGGGFTRDQEIELDIAPEETKNRGGRPKLPRCEHGAVLERCPECNPELLAH